MVPFVKKARAFYAIVTVTLFINCVYVLYWLNLGNPNLTGDPVVLAVSIVNLVTFLYGSLLMWDELKGKSQLKNEALTIGEQNKREVNKDELAFRSAD
jgi:hypothetical protein